MKPERFKRTKSVVASSAIALVVAALVLGLSSLVIGPKGASSTHLGFELTNGSQSFTIIGTIYTTNSPSGAYGPSTTCTGTSPALLFPATTRCVVFSVHNNLKATISVQSITTALDTTNYPAPPADCSGTNLVLPTFSGPSFNVTGSHDANSPGVPIELKDNGLPQNDCEGIQYHFIYTGTATYTEVYGTSTAVTSSANPSAEGNSVTYTATVTANASTGQDPVPSSPTGSVAFYDGTVIPAHLIAGCSDVAVASAMTNTATATCGSPVYGSTGTHFITAVYSNTDIHGNADGNFTGSTSPVFTQTVNVSTFGSATALTSSPDPSALGNPVTLSATVTKTSGTGTPTGTVTFHLTIPTGTVVGTGTLNTSAVATTTTSSLPAGTDNLYAVYGGDTHFLGSTSLVRVQTVIAPPTACSGSYPNFFYGNPAVPVINGTNQGDFVYALGANYVINGNQGNDCLVAGDQNNVITDGNGNDVVIAGNGTNTITVGNGSDNVSVGNGSGTVIVLGNGADTVTVTSPTTALTNTHDTITGGQGGETIFLGSGSHNTFVGGKGKNTCHLPTPPVGSGSAAAYYHDTITNCTVVTP